MDNHAMQTFFRMALSDMLERALRCWRPLWHDYSIDIQSRVSLPLSEVNACFLLLFRAVQFINCISRSPIRTDQKQLRCHTEHTRMHCLIGRTDRIPIITMNGVRSGVQFQRISPAHGVQSCPPEPSPASPRTVDRGRACKDHMEKSLLFGEVRVTCNGYASALMECIVQILIKRIRFTVTDPALAGTT